jgi:hypothetical protein
MPAMIRPSSCQPCQPDSPAKPAGEHYGLVAITSRDRTRSRAHFRGRTHHGPILADCGPFRTAGTASFSCVEGDTFF